MAWEPLLRLASATCGGLDMDDEKAASLEAKLKDRRVRSWVVKRLIDHGKSAAVFLAEDGGRQVALKVFDKDLIKKFGGKTQLARIERELTLIGKTHPNMVGILDGGFDSVTDSYFIVMDYLVGENIKKCLQDIPIENVASFG